jgi:hypothetical protein
VLYSLYMDKTCSKCKQSKPLTREFFHICRSNKDGFLAICKICKRSYDEKYRSYYSALRKKWFLKNPDAKKRSFLRKRYGLSLEEWQRLFNEQNGCCKICGTVMSESGNTSKSCCVDHCHATGKIRGLLCHSCNSAIGLLSENIETLKSAITYLS